MPKHPTTPNGSEVLTLSEAAAFLRIPEDQLHLLATKQAVPARKVGDEWRFLKKALEDWLYGVPFGRGCPSWEFWLNELEYRLRDRLHLEEQILAKSSSKQKILDLAGTWKDDPFVESMLEEIYAKRGRPMTQE
jgi:hypothetical protein